MRLEGGKSRICALAAGFLLTGMLGCGSSPKITDIQSNVNELNRNVDMNQQKYRDTHASREQILSQMQSLLESEVPSITERQQLLEPKASELITSPPPPASSAGQVVAQSGQERADAIELLQTANANYNKGDYKKAAEEYLMTYQYATTGDVKAQCLYQLGNCHYQVKAWEKAVLIFTRLEKEFPTHPILASALLKKGNAQISSGKTLEGKQTLRSIIQRYPTVDEAALAQARLEEINR